MFPGNNALFHPLFALLTFISGGLAEIVSFRMVRAPFGSVLALLGIMTLVFLFISSMFIPVLGDGGTEHFVAYPMVLWMVGFGGYLIGDEGRE